MTLMGYDYVVLGLFMIAVLIIVMQQKSGITHVILGSYLLMILTLGLYRSINVGVEWLMIQPETTGLFFIRYGDLAGFLIHAKMRIISAMVVFFGWQMMYGSSLGALTSRHIVYRLRQTLHIPLAAVGLWILFMLVWAGPSFFTTGINVRSTNTFSDPRIRQVVSLLPGILTAHILLSIIATTVFSAFIDISFRIGKTTRAKDAIYIETEDPVRHVVE